MKLELTELNELLSTVQQDLRTRSQACELVQTCIDEINLFLDSVYIQSDDQDILSPMSLKNRLVSLSLRSSTAMPRTFRNNCRSST